MNIENDKKDAEVEEDVENTEQLRDIKDDQVVSEESTEESPEVDGAEESAEDTQDDSEPEEDVTRIRTQELLDKLHNQKAVTRAEFEELLEITKNDHRLFEAVDIYDDWIDRGFSSEQALDLTSTTLLDSRTPGSNIAEIMDQQEVIIASLASKFEVGRCSPQALKLASMFDNGYFDKI